MTNTTIDKIVEWKNAAYHPQSNGIIERCHRTLKASIKACNTDKWTDVLPMILLGLRSAVREDIGYSQLTQLTYGTTLCLPADLFLNTPPEDASTFAGKLLRTMHQIRPTIQHHGQHKTFVNKHLHDCKYIFLRTDSVCAPLQPPYEGPYNVLRRNSKNMWLDIAGSEKAVSIDRVKPAFLQNLDTPPTSQEKSQPTSQEQPQPAQYETPPETKH
ncbi:uncharacterized protein LOC143922292 [Arctopsyche grandis]|uniref:uncharacterized protein LOC143921862 n=1 Tax=Arctopsyche grandis TaxID=121162 RepID=UPI00406D9F08